MNRPLNKLAAVSASPVDAAASPVGTPGQPLLTRPGVSATFPCPQCDVPMSHRITDEDTGCSYPCDDGEGYCASCDSVWSAEEPTWDEFAAPFRRLADGFLRVEL